MPKISVVVGNRSAFEHRFKVNVQKGGVVSRFLPFESKYLGQLHNVTVSEEQKRMTSIFYLLFLICDALYASAQFVQKLFEDIFRTCVLDIKPDLNLDRRLQWTCYFRELQWQLTISSIWQLPLPLLRLESGGLLAPALEIEKCEILNSRQRNALSNSRKTKTETARLLF